MRTSLQSLARVSALTLALSVLVAPLADAQLRNVGKRISKRAEDRAKARADSAAARAEDKAARTTDKALDAAESATDKTIDAADKVADKTLGAADHVVRCVMRDGPCIRRATAAGRKVVVTDANDDPVSTADSARAIARATSSSRSASRTAPSVSEASSQAPPDSSSAEPEPMPSPPQAEPAAEPQPISPTQPARPADGARTLFFDDYSTTEIGDFPRALQFVAGVGEVVEWEGERYLRTTSRLEFAIPLSETLPERFVVEIPIYHGARRHSWGDATIHFDAGRTPGNPHVVTNWTRGGVAGGSIRAVNDIGQDKFNEAVVPVRIVVDGDYVKVNLGDARVANVPNAKLTRGRKIWLKVPGTDQSPAYVGPIRVTVPSSP